MKIATWNVGYGIDPSKNARILEQMRSVDADIWVLTETHDGLKPRTSGEWRSITSQDRPQDARNVIDGSRWVTLWSRLPIIEEIALSHDPIRTTAAVIDTPLGHLLVFGTVLPWYNDTEHTLKEEIVQQSADWRALQSSRDDIAVCVAGDLNVNLGGPHYYGKNEDKEAVAETLSNSGLTALTDFAHTGPAQFEEFGLIDHIAISDPFVKCAESPEFWQRENVRNETMSDHCGVAVRFTGSI
jgi:endonuclease/exonuclease/phosphatase family metal-dependent hydrolase